MDGTPADAVLDERGATDDRKATEREIAKRLFRIGTRVERWNTSRARNVETGERVDLSIAQLSCLYYIRYGIDTPGELARALLVTPTAITALIDRLEKRGYVHREHDRIDRRKVRLVPTEEGLAVSIASVDAVADSLTHMFASLSEDEVAQVDAGMRLMESALDSVQPLKEVIPRSDRG